MQHVCAVFWRDWPTAESCLLGSHRAKACLLVCRRAKVVPFMRYSYEATSDSEEGGAEEEPDAEEELAAAEEVMEAQWNSYVDKLRQSGQLSSCLAVADVSGSMTGQPMHVCSSGPLPVGCYHHMFCPAALYEAPASFLRLSGPILFILVIACVMLL